MKFSWRMIAAAFSYALGVLGWCYVGGYKILTVRERTDPCTDGGKYVFGTTGGGPDRGIYISFAGRRSLVHWVYVK
mgnify:CR=1 FL=1